MLRQKLPINVKSATLERKSPKWRFFVCTFFHQLYAKLATLATLSEIAVGPGYDTVLSQVVYLLLIDKKNRILPRATESSDE